MKKNELVINLTHTKQELLDYLREYKHKEDYIRVSNYDEYEVCLELTWQQHRKPFVEYHYLANVVDNKLIGKIVKPVNKEQKDNTFRLSFKDVLEIFIAMMLGIGFLYGVPFLIIYAISGMLFLSLGLGVIPLIVLIIFIILEGNHIPVHKQNIIYAIKGIK